MRCKEYYPVRPGAHVLVTRTARKPASRSIDIAVSDSTSEGERTESSAAPSAIDEPPACAAGASASAAAESARSPFKPWLR